MNAISLTRSQAEKSAKLVPKTGYWKAEQWITHHNNHDYWIKDVRYSNPIYRYSYGRFLLWREIRLYRHMEGLNFIPKYYGRLDKDALIFEKLDATPLTKMPLAGFAPEYYDKLENYIRTLHHLGIVHLDIRHRSNCLITPDDEPKLIDFESAIYLGQNRFSRKFLIPLLGRVDYSALLKFRIHDFPELVSEEDKKRYRRFQKWRILWPFGRLWPLPGFRRSQTKNS